MTDDAALIARLPNAQTVECHPAATLEWCREAADRIAALGLDIERGEALIRKHLVRAAQAEALRGLLRAVQREIDAGRGVSEETATAIDAALASAKEPKP